MNIQQTGNECLSKILFNLLTNEETNDELVVRCYNLFKEEFKALNKNSSIEITETNILQNLWHCFCFGVLFGFFLEQKGQLILHKAG